MDLVPFGCYVGVTGFQLPESYWKPGVLELGASQLKDKKAFLQVLEDEVRPSMVVHKEQQ